jgi:hypothetical protein
VLLSGAEGRDDGPPGVEPGRMAPSGPAPGAFAGGFCSVGATVATGRSPTETPTAGTVTGAPGADTLTGGSGGGCAGIGVVAVVPPTDTVAIDPPDVAPRASVPPAATHAPTVSTTAAKSRRPSRSEAAPRTVTPVPR